MKRLFLTILLLCSAWNVWSADTYVQVTLLVTNTPATSNSITINGVLRTWTNATTAGTILTNSVGVGPATTNLFNAIANYPQRSLVITYVGTNSFRLESTNLAITFGGNWASLTNGTTNAISTSYAFMFPFDRLSATNRTNNASELAYGISSYSTQALNGLRMSNVLAFNGTIYRATNGYFTNPITDGGRSTNLYATNLVADNPKTTNLVNYGSAASSPGGGTQSEQFGSTANAATNGATAVGAGAGAIGLYSTALGNFSEANGNYSVALGSGVGADGYGSVAVGTAANASGSNAVAIGNGSTASHSKSIVISTWAQSSSTSNEITIGSSTESVRIAGRTTATLTNSTAAGQSTVSGDVAFPQYSLSSLGGTNNYAIPIGTNVYIRVSGPTAAFIISGIAGGRDGRWIRLLNGSGYTMTLAQNTIDPTAANRLVCNVSGDIPFGDGETVDLTWDTTVSKWRFEVPTATATNALALSGANATNFTVWGNPSASAVALRVMSTNTGSLTATNPFFAWGNVGGGGGILMTNDGATGISFYDLDSAGLMFKVGDNGVVFPLLTANTLLKLSATKAASSVANASGALTNDGSGGIGYFNSFITASSIAALQNSQGSQVLTNLIGTVGNNVTNANANQFTITSGTLTIPSAASITNPVLYGISSKAQSLTVNSNLQVVATNGTFPPFCITDPSGTVTATNRVEIKNSASPAGIEAGFDSNSVAFLQISNSAVQYPASYRIFTQTADQTTTNITTAVTSVVGTGVGSMTLPANFWKVGRKVMLRARGVVWTGASPGSFWMAVKFGSTQLATNGATGSITASLTGTQHFDIEAEVTCRTNSATGYLNCNGTTRWAGTTSDITYTLRQFQQDVAILDTTASGLLDIVCTNGASTTSYKVQELDLTLLP